MESELSSESSAGREEHSPSPIRVKEEPLDLDTPWNQESYPNAEDEIKEEEEDPLATNEPAFENSNSSVIEPFSPIYIKEEPIDPFLFEEKYPDKDVRVKQEAQNEHDSGPQDTDSNTQDGLPPLLGTDSDKSVTGTDSSTPTQGQVEKKHECPACPYKSTRKGSLKRHMLTHTGEKPFACANCDYRASQKILLMNHMNSHREVKPFKCDLCPYKALSKSSLKCHEKVHSEEKPFVCSQCPYRSAHKSHVLRHEKTHSDEKCYSCPICSYKTSDRSALTRHTRNHSGEKPYKCDVCPYRTSFKSNLTIHGRIHTGEKPFPCSFCSYRASQKSSLVTHMRVHRPKEQVAVAYDRGADNSDFSQCVNELVAVTYGESDNELVTGDYSQSDKEPVTDA